MIDLNLTNFHFVDIGYSRVYYYSENMSVIDDWFRKILKHCEQDFKIANVTITNCIDSDTEMHQNVENTITVDSAEQKDGKFCISHVKPIPSHDQMGWDGTGSSVFKK